MKITACLMVKNEEKNLDRCLASIKDCVDEIVIVDTGSTDGTIAIAESYNAKVYHHPWEDNFSKHRNQSISYASKDSDWLLFIDADEELFGQVEDLGIWLETVPEDIDGCNVSMQDMDGDKVMMQFAPPKIFRNGKVKFKNIVHNRPVVKNNTFLYCPNVFFKHYGYHGLTEEQRKAKSDRTLGLLHKRIKQSKSDWQTYYYLSQAYGWINDWENCVRYAEIYLKNKSKQGKLFNPSIYTTGIRAYSQYIDDYDSAKRWLKEALDYNPHDIDALLAMTEIGLQTDNIQMMAAGAQAFIVEYSKFEQTKEQLGSKTVYCYTKESLAFCTYHLGRAQMMQSVQTFNGLGALLPHTDESFRNKVQDELELFLGEIFKRYLIEKPKENISLPE
jgi:glycosyltransferase involved in cell wall biosynthesis